MGTCLPWFRHDLRLADNPALQALLDDGHRPIPVYIHDKPDPNWPPGEASAWWLRHSLAALKQQGIGIHSSNGALLREPRDHLKRDGTPYCVFTPFWKALYKIGPSRSIVQQPKQLPAMPESNSVLITLSRSRI